MTSFAAQDAAQSNAGYYERLARASVAPLWRIPGTTDPEPSVEEVPFLWRWSDVYPLLVEAADVVEVGEEADRRALNAFNPKRLFGTTHTMVAGYQMVLPGEMAPAHRHTPGAIRLMLSGSGHTVVDGEPVLMEPGDLVLTPGMTWHDHRHNGDEPMVWLDGLDVPFVKGLRAGFYEEYPGGALQQLLKPEGDSIRRYGAGSVPAGERPTSLHSPLMNYKWDTSYRALKQLAESSADPQFGTRLEYVNPLTGGHVLPTLACYLQLLKPGEPTRPVRHTSSTIYCVMRGGGSTTAGGQELTWVQNDFFVVPSWTWFEHEATTEEVVLFSMSDLPMLEPFGLFREQRA